MSSILARAHGTSPLSRGKLLRRITSLPPDSSLRIKVGLALSARRNKTEDQQACVCCNSHFPMVKAHPVTFVHRGPPPEASHSFPPARPCRLTANLTSTTALESGVDESVTKRFPGAGEVTIGSAASGAGDNREIPLSEGGGLDPQSGKWVAFLPPSLRPSGRMI